MEMLLPGARLLGFQTENNKCLKTYLLPLLSKVKKKKKNKIIIKRIFSLVCSWISSSLVLHFCSFSPSFFFWYTFLVVFFLQASLRLPAIYLDLFSFPLTLVHSDLFSFVLRTAASSLFPPFPHTVFPCLFCFISLSLSVSNSLFSDF